jgi:hypothetical protein
MPPSSTANIVSVRKHSNFVPYLHDFPISRRLVGTSVTADASFGAKRDVLHASPEALSLGTKGAACYLEPNLWLAQSGR